MNREAAILIQRDGTGIPGWRGRARAAEQRRLNDPGNRWPANITATAEQQSGALGAKGAVRCDAGAELAQFPGPATRRDAQHIVRRRQPAYIGEGLRTYPAVKTNNRVGLLMRVSANGAQRSGNSSTGAGVGMICLSLL